MKILVVGSGGREHALVWKIKQSEKAEKVFCAPGNAGISRMADCVDIAVTDVKKLLKFAKKEKIDLTVVGPESSLVAGLVDTFEKNGLRIFGPTKKAAELEGSKVFLKSFFKNITFPPLHLKFSRTGTRQKNILILKVHLSSLRQTVLLQAKG